MFVVKLMFFSRNNDSSKLGFTGSQLTEDAWLLELSPIYNVRKLTKIRVHIVDWAKIPRAFKKRLVKKYIVHISFFVFYAKQKIDLTWTKGMGREIH